MTSRDVIFDLSEKNDRNTSCRPSPKLSNAVCRFSLRCLVFEISGWGGGRSSAPRPVGAKLAQSPVGARVKICMLWGILFVKRTALTCISTVIYFILLSRSVGRSSLTDRTAKDYHPWQISYHLSSSTTVHISVFWYWWDSNKWAEFYQPRRMC